MLNNLYFVCDFFLMLSFIIIIIIIIIMMHIKTLAANRKE